jgi:hypothetical protein
MKLSANESSIEQNINNNSIESNNIKTSSLANQQNNSSIINPPLSFAPKTNEFIQFQTQNNSLPVPPVANSALN